MAKNRIEVADALRGFSLLGILIMHCILHFNNFYSEGKVFLPDNVFIQALNFYTEKLSFNLIAGKAHGIFALLFGFSFYIQHENQRIKNKDFTYRFIWRMFLLFIIGIINSVFFLGEILIQFAILGLLLPFFIRFKTRTLSYIALFLLLFHFKWITFFCKLIDPDINLYFTDYKDIISKTFADGNIWDIFYCNIRYGIIYTLDKRFWGGNTFYVLALFISGIVMSRKGFFLFSDKNKKIWLRIAIFTACISFVLFVIVEYILDGYNSGIIDELKSVLFLYFNTTMTFCILNVFLLVYYISKMGKHLLSKLEPCGRMSLTVYMSQSIIGGFLYYNWGLNLGANFPAFYSLLLAIAIFIVQYIVCVLWMKRQKQGPIEHIWKKLTWIDKKLLNNK